MPLMESKHPREHYDNTCLKCGYTWTQRSRTKPRKCPNCQTRNWQVQTQLSFPEPPQQTQIPEQTPPEAADETKIETGTPKT